MNTNVFIGQKLLNKNKVDWIGKVAVIEAGYLFCYLRYDNLKSYQKAWDERFPGWEHGLIITIFYKDPQRIMTREEVAKDIELDISLVNDIIYTQFAPLKQTLCMPLAAIEADLEQVENSEK